ncbi:MAG: hypothetical protein ABJK28_00975 [Algibacter sp.]
MKTLIPIFALALLCVSCSSDDNNSNPSDDLYLQIPDAEFESKLILQGIDTDGVINQRMLKTDAFSVTNLNLDFSGGAEIQDLTGIEGFVNLTKLSAFQNEIASLDLKFNTKLDTIWLSANVLKSIDLSYNTKLIQVDIQSNLLESIVGLENLTQLEDINLSFNYLEAFSLDTPSLRTLFISDNDLKTFSVDGAVNLKNIFLKTNLLDEIDLSNNLLLETLVLSDNKLENINLEKNVKLGYMYISSNLLTSLDVSNLDELVWLSTHSNPSLTCIKIKSGQTIPTFTKSEWQELNTVCN